MPLDRAWFSGVVRLKHDLREPAAPPYLNSLGRVFGALNPIVFFSFNKPKLHQVQLILPQTSGKQDLQLFTNQLTESTCTKHKNQTLSRIL